MTSTQDLRYTNEHEWVDARDGVATVGITAYAAERLGDVVYVSLPEVGQAVEAGTVIGEIESTKSVGELFAPMSGTVTAVNEALADSPETVNADAFGEGWIVRIEYTELPDLLDAAQYEELTRV
jgi:glycine cleavage system H protein